jgi:acetyltransferase-like isoleucine patch superfamily enzyme
MRARVRVRRLASAATRAAARVVGAFSARWSQELLYVALRLAGIRLVGQPRYVHKDAWFDLADPSLITLGTGCVVSSGVMILVHDHALSRALAAYGVVQEWDAGTRATVTVGDNVFLGARAILLPGVRVMDGAIVGAGSVVTRDVPSHTVVAGNPARPICTTDEYLRSQMERGGLQSDEAEAASALLAAPSPTADTCT